MQMARRRIEMFHYRQVLVLMRHGDSDRQIASGAPVLVQIDHQPYAQRHLSWQVLC